MLLIHQDIVLLNPWIHIGSMELKFIKGAVFIGHVESQVVAWSCESSITAGFQVQNVTWSKDVCKHEKLQQIIYIYMCVYIEGSKNQIQRYIPVVPHKAVAEVSK